MKKALITGINGQDGSYLAELLLEKGYEVWGTVKRNSVSETQSSRIENLRDSNSVNLEYADLSDMASLVRVLSKVQPDEVYNLAAQSHVRISFDQPIYTANVTGVGTLNLLEAVRLVSPHSKIHLNRKLMVVKVRNILSNVKMIDGAVVALHLGSVVIVDVNILNK